MVKELDNFPKSIKKAVRYIKQDASQDQLEEIKKLFNYAISVRNTQLCKETK